MEEGRNEGWEGQSKIFMEREKRACPTSDMELGCLGVALAGRQQRDIAAAERESLRQRVEMALLLEGLPLLLLHGRPMSDRRSGESVKRPVRTDSQYHRTRNCRRASWFSRKSS